MSAELSYIASTDYKKNKIDKKELIVDNNNYDKSHYRELLNRALLKDKPYTEIISNDIKALSVLSDEVASYNQFVSNNEEPDRKIMIHQHLTAPISKENLNVLFSLTAEQRQQIRLYSVGLTDEIMDKLYLNKHDFAGIYRIDPKNNSIKKEEFKDEKYDKYLGMVDNLRDLCEELFNKLNHELKKNKITQKDYDTIYLQVHLLKDSLSSNKAVSNQTKLKDFRKQFESSAEKALNSLDGGLIKSIILQIKYQLSKLFSIQSAPTFFSAKEDLINKVEDSLLNNDDFKPS